MKKIIVSAPGKLMLFGEHAVLYGHPCIVTAVGQRMFLTVSQIANGKPASPGEALPPGRSQMAELRIDAPDVQVNNYSKSMDQLGEGEIPKGTRFIEIAVKNFLDFLLIPLPGGERARVREKKFQDDKLGLHITTKSEFSSTFGFGSSSASTVCVIKALSELFGLRLTNKEIFDLSYKTVLDIQGKGSGFDVAAAIYGGTLYFFTGGKTIEQILSPCHCDPDVASGEAISYHKRSPSFDFVYTESVRSAQDDDNCKNSLPLIVGYSGVKADTVTLINKVSEKAKENPELVNRIYDNITKIVEKAKIALEGKDWRELGRLMNVNQTYLAELGVSSEKLDAMIKAATSSGAYGAKLSGAGGGDCMIALDAKRNKRKVISKIEKVGGQVIDVKTNVEGVRVEENQKSEIKDQKQDQK